MSSMESKEINQNFIFVKPEYLSIWSYQIDNGKKHSIREEEVYPYVKGFLKDAKEWAKAVDIISRHQPFMIIFEERTIKELHPSMQTEEYHREKIAEDLSKAMYGLENQGTVLGENIRSLRMNSRKEDSADKFLRERIRYNQSRELSNNLLKSRVR